MILIRVKFCVYLFQRILIFCRERIREPEGLKQVSNASDAKASLSGKNLADVINSSVSISDATDIHAPLIETPASSNEASNTAIKPTAPKSLNKSSESLSEYRDKEVGYLDAEMNDESEPLKSSLVLKGRIWLKDITDAITNTSSGTYPNTLHLGCTYSRMERGWRVNECLFEALLILKMKLGNHSCQLRFRESRIERRTKVFFNNEQQVNKWVLLLSQNILQGSI